MKSQIFVVENATNPGLILQQFLGWSIEAERLAEKYTWLDHLESSYVIMKKFRNLINQNNINKLDFSREDLESSEEFNSTDIPTKKQTDFNNSNVTSHKQKRQTTGTCPPDPSCQPNSFF